MIGIFSIVFSMLIIIVPFKDDLFIVCGTMHRIVLRYLSQVAFGQKVRADKSCKIFEWMLSFFFSFLHCSFHAIVVITFLFGVC